MSAFDKSILPSSDQALSGRDVAVAVAEQHVVLGSSMKDFQPPVEVIYLGLGCFWGAERKFWQTGEVVSTAVGYGGGLTPNPTYEEVCTGGTGHTELVLVAYDPSQTSLESLLKVFWESHDPTQGMRQGNDRGTQYRSAIYCTTSAQLATAKASKDAFQTALSDAGFGDITTEITSFSNFYYAEDYHQQYLHKNPNGYCGIGGCAVDFSMPV
ncbi:peptide-methionine (S)-S-oxide reductase MsrA [Marinibactrum halimedae]|uniref:Peptide methionine sulfoxide reductase MsrA n=1 Tax=Marinibactrum halimedae TaxID=1444977 RepID=A0AA37WN89_9GAMM|nr:peptide-methionine (S)-S-oxide reductase MsrA [Marinibactrum halimedae]MCD9460643.1 peptide-methionine (S)-S-oxide reductase MsrA [Marinibactrum halimedae]GLS27859.1 peptide methionine sulfoxide reductase MsrA [Marinibactrum halimedae]